MWLLVKVLGTIWLGRHYVVDDVAGVALAAAALGLARLLTGIDLKATRTRQEAVGEAAPVEPPVAERELAGASAD